MAELLAIMPVLVRIALRYLAGALVAWGVSVEDAHLLASDPAVIGAVVAVVTEGAYWAARRMGWQT